MTRKTLHEKRSKARQMDPWETDENGEYAGEMAVFDSLAILGFVPFIGVAYSLSQIFAGYEISGSGTGVSQQAIRAGHVGLVSQVIWTAALFGYWLVI